MPFINALPRSWKTPWLPMAQVWNIWKAGYGPFHETRSDTFILATPTGNILWTCDPCVVKHVLTQHGKTQLPTDIMRFYDLWGPTVGSVEGDEWRNHRKVITAAFTPATNALVWNETVKQTDSLLSFWVREGAVVPVIKSYTSKLALHVISAVFFARSMTWEQQPPETKILASGHKLSYEQALFTVIERLGIIFITPRALLRALPFKATREAYTAFVEWTNYMQELRAGTVARMEEVVTKRHKTILESIVVAGTPGLHQSTDHPLKEPSVLGNIFFTLLAGHETTGNTMAFTLILLTVYPEFQKKVQQELDRHFGDRAKDQWTVEQDYAPLQQGYLGAVQKEVLRVYNVVEFLLRKTATPTTVIDSSGSSHLIPENTLCLPNLAASFRHPAKWSKNNISRAKRTELHDSPAIDFDPSRWLDAGEDVVDKETDSPLHWPFGQGVRSCPGRAFAQTEMIAAVATIFKDYSLQLVVDEATLESCQSNPQQAWEATRDKALRMLIDDIECNINIYLIKDLPIKVVRR
ncbi:MAG: hypothetical protein M1821_003984 [Bathelium mastoideum]|nr:MAG: hypothetical protein M1821_003984 [Bathelium mastoideum]